LHDSTNLETASIPTLVVASDAFVQAADHQSRKLGIDPTIVWVPHPIQDRTDAEVRGIADKVFDEIVGKMTA
jgi:hypothetical protein